jgi:hypothetical protein
MLWVKWIVQQQERISITYPEAPACLESTLIPLYAQAAREQLLFSTLTILSSTAATVSASSGLFNLRQRIVVDAPENIQLEPASVMVKPFQIKAIMDNQLNREQRNSYTSIAAVINEQDLAAYIVVSGAITSGFHEIGFIDKVRFRRLISPAP